MCDLETSKVKQPRPNLGWCDKERNTSARLASRHDLGKDIFTAFFVLLLRYLNKHERFLNGHIKTLTGEQADLILTV